MDSAEDIKQLTQHQRLARGVALPTSEEYDVDTLASRSAGGPTPARSGYMPDSARHAPVKNRGSALANQANPDHGPHF